MLSKKPLLKDVEIFKTEEDVRNFREFLERSTREAFIEMDKNKRLSWVRARDIILD